MNQKPGGDDKKKAACAKKVAGWCDKGDKKCWEGKMKWCMNQKPGGDDLKKACAKKVAGWCGKDKSCWEKKMKWCMSKKKEEKEEVEVEDKPKPTPKPKPAPGDKKAACAKKCKGWCGDDKKCFAAKMKWCMSQKKEDGETFLL